MRFGPTLVLLALLAIAYVVMMHFPVHYIVLVGEDRLAESMTAAAFFLASMLFLFPAIGAGGMARIVLLGLAAVCFGIAGEEISWGQRLLGYETLAPVKAYNWQNEMTLHNMGRLQYAPFHAVAGIAMLGLALVAMAPNLLGPIRDWIPVPSRFLAPAFCVAGLILLVRPYPKGDEIAELLLGLAVLFWACDTFAQNRGGGFGTAFLVSLVLALAMGAALERIAQSGDRGHWRANTLAVRDFPKHGLEEQALEILDDLNRRGHLIEEYDVAKARILSARDAEQD